MTPKKEDITTKFERNTTADIAYTIFKPLADSIAMKKPHLKRDLKKTNMNVTPEQFVAVFLLAFIVTTFLVLPLLYLVVIPLFAKMLKLSGFILSVVRTLILLIPLYTFLYFWGSGGLWDKFPTLPKRKARARGKKIDLYLPYAATYIASMAAANATLPVIFKSLASQKEKKKGLSLWLAKAFEGDEEKEIYPEICKEAAKIYKDITLLGLDAVTALKNAIERAPSPKFAEFLQGIFSTITSGGDLKKYFLNSAEHYMEDNKQKVRDDMNFVALMAETYVVVGVAMPIFILIILIITQWISRGAGGMDASTLYLIIFGLLPTIHLSFAGLIYSKTKQR